MMLLSTGVPNSTQTTPESSASPIISKIEIFTKGSSSQRNIANVSGKSDPHQKKA